MWMIIFSMKEVSSRSARRLVPNGVVVQTLRSLLYSFKSVVEGVWWGEKVRCQCEVGKTCGVQVLKCLDGLDEGERWQLNF